MDLANAAGLSVWINVPHMATDDYILQLVHLVDGRLDKRLNVMVEFSNEVWNVRASLAVQCTHVPPAVPLFTAVQCTRTASLPSTSPSLSLSL